MDDTTKIGLLVTVLFSPVVYFGYLMYKYDHPLVQTGKDIVDHPAGGLITLGILVLLMAVGSGR